MHIHELPIYEEHITTIKIQILQFFLKYATFKTYFCRPFFGQPQLFLTLGVTVPNTINTYEFCPSIIPGLKFKIPSQYFVAPIGFSKFVSTFNFFHMLLCLHSIIHCKFYTLTDQSLLLWHKYLESLGKNNVFTHVFLSVCPGGQTRKRTIAQQSRGSSKLC